MFSFLVGPLALALGVPLAVAAVDGWLDWRRERRLAAAGLLPMDRADRLAFARPMAELVRAHAEPLARRLSRGGRGADLALFRDDTAAVILGRRWRGTAGVRAVQRAGLEVLATKAVHRADRAIGRLVTTSRVTMRTAAVLARANGAAVGNLRRPRELRRLAGARKPHTAAPR